MVKQKLFSVVGLAMFVQFKSETAFRVKSISVSSQVKHCQIETSGMVAPSKVGNLALDPSYLFFVAACLSYQWVFFLRNDSRTKKLRRLAGLISIQFTQFLRPIKRDFPSQCPTQRPSLLQSRELCSSYYHVHNGVKLFFKCYALDENKVWYSCLA